MSKLVSGSVKPSDLASKAALDRFVLVNDNLRLIMYFFRLKLFFVYLKLHSNDKLRRLQCSLDSDGYAVVLKESKNIFFMYSILND